jgi:ABC-type Fe3+/spermidine/putrescine transport system ATPase subunit
VTALTLERLTKTFQRAGMVVDSIDLQIVDGEFFTLLGPSGCGKSTILRMIAGFEEPTSGRILFDQRDVTCDPPNHRDVGFVFQNYALFPHLPVFRNVAFGLEVRRLPQAEVEQRVSGALQQVQLSGLAAARVDQLSGGQQQRVALARALVISPKLLLLDEPLSNLDAKLREETRAMLRTLHGSTHVTTVYVTHDQAEAMGMSDRIAILYRGKIQQLATPQDIYERPANRFVADFIGRNNVLDATLVRVAGDAVALRFEDGTELSVDSRAQTPELNLNPGARVGVCIRAEALRLTDGNGVFHGVMTDVEFGGPSRLCVVQTGIGELRVEVPGSGSSPARGDAVRLCVVENAVHLVEAATP